VQGGLSPDRQIEIVLSQPDEAAARPMALFRRRPAGAVIGQVFVGAYVTFEQARLPANTEALWKPDSHRVALKVCTGPNRTEVIVYTILGDKIREQQLSDPQLDVLRRYTTIDIYRLGLARPLRWNPDGTLTTQFTGNCILNGVIKNGKVVDFVYELQYDAETGSADDLRLIAERTSARK
jgi:hypothetical protein